MPRELVRRAVPAQRAEPLPAAYWTRLEDVRVPGRPDRIDLVLVGPSGVHVVVDRPGVPATGGEVDDDLTEAAQRAAAASAAVAGLVPDRYRQVVTSEVSLQGATDVAVDVGAVLAASPDVLQHVWRHRPRVLSTSEAAAMAGLLRGRLEPVPVEHPPRAGRWWRRRSRRSVVAAAALAGLAAGAAVAADAGGVSAPWGLR